MIFTKIVFITFLHFLLLLLLCILENYLLISVIFIFVVPLLIRLKMQSKSLYSSLKKQAIFYWFFCNNVFRNIFQNKFYFDHGWVNLVKNQSIFKCISCWKSLSLLLQYFVPIYLRHTYSYLHTKFSNVLLLETIK